MQGSSGEIPPNALGTDGVQNNCIWIENDRYLMIIKANLEHAVLK